MATASTLARASDLSYQQLSIASTAGTLKAKLSAFIASCQPLFDDNDAKQRTVGNWLIPMQAVATNMYTATAENAVPLVQLMAAVDLVARICMATNAAVAGNLIPNGSATALLAAWNAQFGT